MTRGEDDDDDDVEKKKRRVKYWPLTVLVRKRTTSRMRDVLRTLSESFRDRLKRFDSTHNTDKYVCEQRFDVLLLIRFLFSLFLSLYLSFSLSLLLLFSPFNVEFSLDRAVRQSDWSKEGEKQQVDDDVHARSLPFPSEVIINLLLLLLLISMPQTIFQANTLENRFIPFFLFRPTHANQIH